MACDLYTKLYPLSTHDVYFSSNYKYFNIFFHEIILVIDTEMITKYLYYKYFLKTSETFTVGTILNSWLYLEIINYQDRFVLPWGGSITSN